MAYKKSSRKNSYQSRKSRNSRNLTKISRKLSRKKSSISPRRRKCNKLLSEKISANLKELKSGRWTSREQAIAVSYSQVRKRHPSCKKEYTRK